MEGGMEQLQKKLNELKQYHEEQRNFIMNNSQEDRLLTKEQVQLCGALGLSISSFLELQREENDDLAEMLRSEEDDDDAEDPVIPRNEIEPVDDSDIEYPDEDSEEEIAVKSPIKEYNNELVENIKLPAGKKPPPLPLPIDEGAGGDGKRAVKRPFLRRGAGIQKTFGITPDKFDLKKLPRYKYQDRVQKTLAKTKNKACNEPEKKKKEVTKKPAEYPSKNTEKKVEQQQQQSTELSVPVNVQLKIPRETKQQSSPPVPLAIERFVKPANEAIKETPKNPKFPKGSSWAQILTSNTIASCPVDVENLIDPMMDRDPNETSIFQLLEQQLMSLNINQSPESVARLLATLQKQDQATDETLVNPDDPLVSNMSKVNLEIRPRPEEIQEKIAIDSDESEEEEDDEEEEDSQARVRFASNVEVMNDEDQNSTILSSDMEAVELSQTSTPNERRRFEDFKKKMVGTQRLQMTESVRDLEQKAYLLKTKLEDIEREKTSVMKLRSELELEKIQLEHDREDMIERTKDEKIKLEMGLHDERLKIEQQRQKLDNLMRAAKTPSKKEREEIAKLKETVDELKEDMKAKESRHAAAQARYRSQIKQLEKENQTLKLELEAVRKDNKKMEVENARLKRDTSNKMLQEINKNIAKLAQPESSNSKKAEAAKKKEPVRRKSEPVKSAVGRKRVQSVPDLSSNSSSEDEENDGNFNPTRLRISEPIRKPHQTSSSSSDVLSEMKREIVNSDGSKDIWYPNGNLKKISPDGMMIRMLYYNKDIKETNITEGTVKYYYSDSNTWHTTYIDGLEILEYPNGEIEHRYKDGTVEVHHTDGSIRITNKNWKDDVKEEWRLPDGTNAKIFGNNTKILSFPNGQREVHTANHKRREYPDGTVKIMYDDGTMETRYSNGRIRVKDKDGNLISDNIGK